MSQQKIDVTNASDWANLFINLFDKGEWKILIVTLALTYSITYAAKIIYLITVPDKLGSSLHIRLLAIVSGLLAAAMLWHEHHLDMEWYAAGLLVGVLSIMLHHILYGVVNMKAVKTKLPFLSKLLKGTIK